MFTVQSNQHAAAVPSRTYPFSSDHSRQTGLGSISIRLSNRSGTLNAIVLFYTFLLHTAHKLTAQQSVGGTHDLLLHAINIALIAPSKCQQHNVQTACHSHQHSESTGCYFAAWVSPPCAQAAGLTAKVHVVTSQQHPTSLCMTLLHVPCLATCGAHMSWQNVTLLTLPTTSVLHLLSAQIIQISTASEAKCASRH